MKYLLCGVVLLHAILCLLLLNQVVCKSDDKDTVLQGLNSYRQAQNLRPLAKNDNAMCLADELADQVDDKPCSVTCGANVLPGTGPQFSNYQNLLSKCDIHINHTRDGVILPVCVPDLVPTLVLTNYTHTQYAKYLNDSKYRGAGLGTEDDWMVLVLSTDTPGGTFASGACSLLVGSGLRSGVCCMVLSWIMGLFLSS